MVNVAIVDYGMGNLRSVEQAIRHVAPDLVVAITDDARVIAQAERVVFPGQGAMPDCMRELEARGLRGAVLEAARTRPFLGICIGLQMLFEHSAEGDVAGLGILSGEVLRFAANMHDEKGGKLKVPHMGWNQVHQFSEPIPPPAPPLKGGECGQYREFTLHPNPPAPPLKRGECGQYREFTLHPNPPASLRPAEGNKRSREFTLHPNPPAPPLKGGECGNPGLMKGGGLVVAQVSHPPLQGEGWGGDGVNAADGLTAENLAHPLWSGIAQDARFYFVHSYYVRPQDASLVQATSDYPQPFVCAVARDNLFAVQFHPEKSHAAGLKLLQNFVQWNP